MSIKIEREIVDYSIVKEHTGAYSQQSLQPTPQVQKAADVVDANAVASAAPAASASAVEGKAESVNADNGANSVRAESSASTPASTKPNPATSSKILQMWEKVERPAMLLGSTYKIKTPISDHAFYITINDIVLNQGTPHEKRHPFEMFINSKNMDHYQWISALTRIISAVFRKGGDIAFLVEELKSIFDPKGGYFRRGGKYMPSLVAEIGDVIEEHLTTIGVISASRLDQHQRKLIEQQREKFAKRQKMQADSVRSGGDNDSDSGNFPPNAQLCKKCHHKAMVVMDNCLTCLNCGESKCS